MATCGVNSQFESLQEYTPTSGLIRSKKNGWRDVLVDANIGEDMTSFIYKVFQKNQRKCYIN